MREIKFRAWNVATKTMVDLRKITPLVLYQDVSGIFIPDETDGLFVMQFTGLLDKHGKEIYEGDLLRIPAKDKYEEITFNCFEVFYHDNDCIGGQNIGFCMNRMHPQGHSGGGRGYKFTPDSIRDHGFIVIGNIYENPELLEDK